MDGERLYVGTPYPRPSPLLSLIAAGHHLSPSDKDVPATMSTLGSEYVALITEHAFVGKGQYLKRIRMHGRGRSATMYKYRSHLTVSGEDFGTRLWIAHAVHDRYGADDAASCV